jgi:hypothetical protein
MQIGLLNHLNFPKGSNLPLSANSDDSTAAADSSATPGQGVAALAPAQAPPPDAPGVVLKLQGDAATNSAGLAKGLVYTDDLKAAANKKPKDFVSFAVSAMRDFADEQARLKAAGQSGDSTSPSSLIPRSLAEMQKLANRFKLFT